MQPIVLKSKKKQIEVNFPEGVVVKSNGKDFTGIMMVPEYGTGTTTGTIDTQATTIVLGNPNTPMNFEDEK